MRAYLPDYELLVPSTLEEALALLTSEPGVWRPFAGGTDLMVLLEAGNLRHRKFFSLWRLGELRGIEETAEHVTLGALTTYSEVRRNETLRREFPMLCRAASETGGPAIQNRGTLGGNISNASPAADSSPPLLAYDAEIKLASADGTRWVQYENFHTGYRQTILRHDELVTHIRLPRRKGDWRHYYRKVGTRKAQAISKVCFAGVVALDDGAIRDVRIALGSVAPTVLKCVRTENLLRGQVLDPSTIKAARAELAREVVPIDDIRSTSDYRRRVAANLLEEFLSGT